MKLMRLAMAVVVSGALNAAALGQSIPRVIAGPGVPMMVQGVGGAASVKAKGAAEVAINSASFTVRSDAAGVPDAAWYWLTGSPTALKWESVEKPAEMPGGSVATFTWGEPLPREAASAKTVTVGMAGGKTRDVSLVWLADLDMGREVIAKAAEAAAARVPMPERAQAIDSLHAALAMPGERWRARALVRALGKAKESDLSATALEALSKQVEALHAGVLGRIARADRGLADQAATSMLLLARLPMGEVGNGEGVWTPGWTVREGGGMSGPDSLLDTVLEAGAEGGDKQIITHVQSWLAGQPGHIVWVRDDAGLRDALRGAQISTLGVVLMNADKALASAETAAVRSGELTPLKLGVGQWLTATGPAVPRDAAISERMAAATAGGRVTVHIGDRTAEVTALGVPVPAQPPGLSIGPFAADYTLASWRSGQVMSVTGTAGGTGGGETMGMLLRGGAGGGGVVVGSAWKLYIECRGVDGADGSADKVRVWLGPSGSPVSVLEVSPAGDKGKVKVVRGARPQGEVAISRTASGWCATVPLPSEAVESGGVLRLALERFDSMGRHSAWPRAMLPGQTEPGRLAIDTSAWDRGVEKP